MDETAVAFAPPHARALASHAGPPPDRISVRDYVRDIDIGAFRSEQGVAQRIRFNIVLEVSHHAAAATDDVDQVVSYDSITQAIEAALSHGRVDLLETLAERVAARCLSDPRALRVFVRIEKLDRVPGSLGVEIVRSRVAEDTARLRPQTAETPVARSARPIVVHFGRGVSARECGEMLDAAAPVVVCMGPEVPEREPATDAERRIGLLAVDRAVWQLAGSDPRLVVVESRTELRDAPGGPRLAVWAPGRVAGPVASAPDASNPLGLAAWLADQIDAAGLVLVRAGAGPVETSVPVRRVDVLTRASLDGFG